MTDTHLVKSAHNEMQHSVEAAMLINEHLLDAMRKLQETNRHEAVRSLGAAIDEAESLIARMRAAVCLIETEPL